MKYYKYINYSRQSINSSDIKNVSQSLRDEFLTQGNKIIKFETNLRNFFKCKYSLAVSNGTAALFLSLKALNLKKNDSIIISPFTFVAAVNCCKLLNLKEKFIDIDPLTLNIDLNLVEKEIKKKKYKAIIVTDYGGLPADWERLNFIRKKYNIFGEGGVKKTAEEFDKEFLGEIPINPEVGKSGDKGKPIVEEDPNNEISKIYINFANKIKSTYL